MTSSENSSPAPVHRLVGRIHHDTACCILRDVLACWCAKIPMEQRRDIRDKAIKYLSDARIGLGSNPIKQEG